MKIGILGGGQLARMLALAGYPLGMEFMVLDPAGDACARPLAQGIQAPYGDPAGLERLAREVDLVTYEFENVPAEAVARLQGQGKVFPGPLALATARDRLAEKRLFHELEIETAPFAAVEDEESLAAAVDRVGLPAILKSRTLGYDGKGQVRIGADEEPRAAWRALGEVPAILEGVVAFEREVSLIGVRGRDGAMAFYPLAENLHGDGILRLSRSRPGDPLQSRAETLVARILERLDYVGVLAVEFFQVGEQLLANEMAPRVHNSGHWTIEGAVASQFENHLRAVAGWPLGATSPTGHAAMVNLIGEAPPPSRVLKIPGAHLHLYGKASRPGRKVGHVTLVDAQQSRLEERLADLLEVLGEGGETGE